jgi:hypothetical protein
MQNFKVSRRRIAFKKEKLLNKLSLAVDKLRLSNLPATIMAIYAFGSILRDKEQLHDIDFICLYSQTPEQIQRWQKFRNNFSGIDFLKHGRDPIHELWPLLRPYYENQKK